MKSRHFDHIDLRVRNIGRAKKFYRPLMKALGFTKESSNPEWTSYYVPRKGKKLTTFFGFTHDPKHKPNGTRIAFWAASRAEVDRVAKVARAGLGIGRASSAVGEPSLRLHDGGVCRGRGGTRGEVSGRPSEHPMQPVGASGEWESQLPV